MLFSACPLIRSDFLSCRYSGVVEVASVSLHLIKNSHYVEVYEYFLLNFNYWLLLNVAHVADRAV